jgi:hypothetical protein
MNGSDTGGTRTLVANMAALDYGRGRKDILLVVKRDRVSGRRYYILPGGKVDEGETPEECLRREIERKELPGSSIDLFLRVPEPFYGKNFSGRKSIEVRLYVGTVENVSAAGGEILGFRWMSWNEALAERESQVKEGAVGISETTWSVMAFLRSRKWL